MKKVFLLVMFSLLTAVVFAVPYASQITVSVTQVASGAGLDITYFVNEAGGTVTIEIVEEATPSNVAATFAGTATLGSNTVSWDGTNNNAGGTAVANGNYRVEITVNATNAAGWAEIHSNSSLGNFVPSGIATEKQTLWDGFSGMEWLIDLDPDRDSFGYILCSSSFSAPRIDGHVVFNPDLSTYDGGDGQSTWMNFPGTPSNNQGVWGNCFDPEDPNYVWVAGQDDVIVVSIMRGKWNATTLTDVTNTQADLLYARDIVVAIEGSNKYAYVTASNAQIWKCDVTNDIIAASPAPFNILGLSDTARYSKGVEFDSNLNLYWASRRNNTDGTGGAIYRWDASLVQAATAGSLTEANASWDVQFPTGTLDVEGVAIDRDGDVYAACATESAGDGSVRGIYLIGNVSSATNVKTLSTSTDRVVAYPSEFDPSGFGQGIGVDYAGNLYISDRGDEQVRAYGPQGTTSIDVLAPTSQTFFIGLVSARNWILYE